MLPNASASQEATDAADAPFVNCQDCGLSGLPEQIAVHQTNSTCEQTRCVTCGETLSGVSPLVSRTTRTHSGDCFRSAIAAQERDHEDTDPMTTSTQTTDAESTTDQPREIVTDGGVATVRCRSCGQRHPETDVERGVCTDCREQQSEHNGYRVITDGGTDEPRTTHVDSDGVRIPPDLREFNRQIVFRTPRATIQHFGQDDLDPYYGAIKADQFGDLEDMIDARNPHLAPDRMTIKPQGEDPIEFVVTVADRSEQDGLVTDGGVDLKAPASTCTAEDPTRCDACGQPFKSGQSVAIGEIATVRVPNGQPIFETERTITRRHESCPDDHTEPDDPSPMYPEQDDARNALLNGDPGPYRFELTFEYTNPRPDDAGRRMNRPEGKTGVAMEVAESSEQAREQLHETAAEHGREIEIAFTSVYVRADR